MPSIELNVDDLYDLDPSDGYRIADITLLFIISNSNVSYLTQDVYTLEVWLQIKNK